MPETTEAAKAAPAPKSAPELPPGHVMVRVLKRGDRKIFTGETCPNDAEKFPTWRFGDIVSMPRSVAEFYDGDEKGWVEIQP